MELIQEQYIDAVLSVILYKLDLTLSLQMKRYGLWSFKWMSYLLMSTLVYWEVI